MDKEVEVQASFGQDVVSGPQPSAGMRFVDGRNGRGLCGRLMVSNCRTLVNNQCDDRPTRLVRAGLE